MKKSISAQTVNPGIASKISRMIKTVEQLTIIRTVRSGLVSMIPVLLIGAFALILKSFPVPGYQKMIEEGAGGFFLDLFNLVYNATFGVLSLYMTFFISRSYMRIKSYSDSVHGGAAVAAMIAFFILAGSYLPSFNLDNMGPKSMFLALVTGLGASYLYEYFYMFFSSRGHYLYSAGADMDFNRMLSTIFPIALVTMLFALLNAVVIRVFNMDSFLALLATAFNKLFSYGSNGFAKGFFFVLLSSVLWFFGIHGSDTLEGVMQTYFAPGLEANQAAVAAGGAPSAVLTKEFFDCFVLMGGCGTTICLLIAIIAFSRNSSRRSLGIAAAFPMIFNINEMMVFGLPIIFNPVMLIPFLTVPLVCYSVAYLAISMGLVPMITSNIEWTTPIVLGGYYATGSAAGSVLQLVNLALGVAIYTPFIRLLDRQTADDAKQYFSSFMQYYLKNEQEFTTARLTDHANVYSDFVKGLCADLRYGLDRVVLYYQPQYHYDKRCSGVEALLRWEHHDFGMLYPPLVVKLAEEGGFLPELEEAVIKKALSDRPKVLKRFGEDVKLSINVTGTTVVTPRFIKFCQKLNEKKPFKGNNICLEVTEQAALSFNKETLLALRELRNLGLMLAIDDFSMGQTSLNYLKDNAFDIIKLDGSLVKGLFEHNNCREIISSITQLAESLDLSVIAEFVETEEQMNELHEIGCDCYQGYLFSPAVAL